MGFIDDLKEMLDDIDIEELAEDADHITVEIVTNKKDLDKRIKELKEEGYTLATGEPDEPDQDEDDDEDLPEDEEELEEVLRMKARKSFGKMVKEIGAEKAKQHVELAMYRGIIDNLLERKIPLDPDAVEKYNNLCREENPEACDPDVLEFLYLVVRHMAEKKKREILDG